MGRKAKNINPLVKKIFQEKDIQNIADVQSIMKGMFKADDFIVYLREVGYEDFTMMLNRNDELGISQLPGFMPKDDALTLKTSKNVALKKVEKLGIEKLPVLDGNGKFFELANRSKLTTSLILKITEDLSNN